MADQPVNVHPVADIWRGFISRYSLVGWSWRLLVGLLVFPVAYYLFGWLVLPFVRDYYQTQFAGLKAPTLADLLPVLFTRSLLFLLCILPLIAAWDKSRLSLFAWLGFSLFLLVGGVGMISGYWLPVSMRFAHSLEIIANSFVHAGALTLLFTKKEAEQIAVIGEKESFA